MVLGSSMGVFIGFSPGGDTGWEERTPVGMEPGENMWLLWVIIIVLEVGYKLR